MKSNFPSFIFHDTMNAKRYITILQDEIWPIISTQENIEDLIFMQDGTLLHFAIVVCEWLNSFGRWMGRCSPHEWPARSPNLTSNTFRSKSTELMMGEHERGTCPSGPRPGIHAWQLFANYDSLAFGAIPPGLCLLAGLSLLLGAWGTPLEECWQGLVFFHLPRMFPFMRSHLHKNSLVVYSDKVGCQINHKS